jgi:hypothetical protein
MVRLATKICFIDVTGGFRSIQGMVSALKTVDGIGLGRTITEQVTLPKDILEGRITSARAQALDMNDFGLTAAISMTQMVQIGDDQQPLDMSRPENVEAFAKDFAAHMAVLEADRDKRVKFGSARISSVPTIPYTGGLAPRL